MGFNEMGPIEEISSEVSSETPKTNNDRLAVGNGCAPLFPTCLTFFSGGILRRHPRGNLIQENNPAMAFRPDQRNRHPPHPVEEFLVAERLDSRDVQGDGRPDIGVAIPFVGNVGNGGRLLGTLWWRGRKMPFRGKGKVFGNRFAALTEIVFALAGKRLAFTMWHRPPGKGEDTQETRGGDKVELAISRSGPSSKRGLVQQDRQRFLGPLFIK